MNAMEKAIYSALYDVLAAAWHQVETEDQAPQQAANDTHESEIRKAA